MSESDQQTETVEKNHLTKDNGKQEVRLQCFQTLCEINKKGKEVKRLKATISKAKMKQILDFLSEQLPKIIRYINQLKHYRTVIHKFEYHFGCTGVDIDFSKNLSIPGKEQPTFTSLVP